MLKKTINITLTLGVLFGITACGGGSDSKKSDDNKTTGYFIDSPVKGINYECADIKGVTDASGTFSCEKAPVTFKLGEMTIGTLNTFTADNKMYPQDLLGLPRNNFSDEKLIKLIRLLQSLDDDEDIAKMIDISSDISNNYTSALDFDKSILEVLSAPVNGDLVSEDDAIKHLQDSMGADAHIGTSETDGDDIERTSDDILEDVVNNFSDDNQSSDSGSSLDGVDMDALSGDNNLTQETLPKDEDESSSNPVGDVDALVSAGGSEESGDKNPSPNIDNLTAGNEGTEGGEAQTDEVDVNSLIDENRGNNETQTDEVDADSLIDENSGNNETQTDDQVDADSLIEENSGDNTTTSKKKTGTGFYVDSAIEGVQYECGEQSGVTDSNGTFTFEEGQRCIFKLEGVLLRQVEAVDLENNMILLEDNIDNARLLQSLDNDGNSDNGIEISKNILDGLIASDLTAVPVGDTEIKAFFKELGVTDIAGFDGEIKTLDEVKLHLQETKNEIERLQEIVDNNNVSEEEIEGMTDEIETSLNFDSLG